MFTGLQLRGLLRQDRGKSLISGPSSVELGWFLSDGNNDNLEGISFASFGDLVVSTSSFRYPICGLSGSFDFENIFYLAIRRVSLGYSALPWHISFPYSGVVERVEILDEKSSMVSLSHFRDILSICTRCHAAALHPSPSLSTFQLVVHFNSVYLSMLATRSISGHHSYSAILSVFLGFPFTL
jgi:hypothetical protein